MFENFKDWIRYLYICFDGGFVVGKFLDWSNLGIYVLKDEVDVDIELIMVLDENCSDFGVNMLDYFISSVCVRFGNLGVVFGKCWDCLYVCCVYVFWNCGDD